jgi:DNA-binding response OmpR family regulator
MEADASIDGGSIDGAVIDGVLLAWQANAGRLAHHIRGQGYRGPMIAALPWPSPTDVVAALAHGCDDAQAFPLPTEELAARVMAIGQRQRRGFDRPARILAGDLEIGHDGEDPRIDGRRLKVSPSCARVLAIVAAARTPVPLERIASALYGAERPSSNTVKTYLSMLRSIMATATRRDGWLKLRDGGYVLFQAED